MKQLYIITLLILILGFLQVGIFVYFFRSKTEIQELKEETSIYKDFTNFQNRVITEFIPLIEKNLQIVPRGTNYNKLSGISSVHKRFILPCMTNYTNIVAQPYKVNGKTYFRYNGFDYKLGDVFEGSLIIHISPSIARTFTKSYLFTSENNRLSSLLPKGMPKGN